jgi:HD-like signal output (HDOD) protein
MSAVSAEQIVAQVETLPRLPAAAMRLIRLLHNADSTLDQIVDTVRFDQTITTQLLRACNSAYWKTR